MSACCVPGSARSSIGTINGGSATICSSPSTSPASRVNSRELSRVRAFAISLLRFPQLPLAEPLLLDLDTHPLEQLIDLDVRVPRVQRAHLRRQSHRPAVGLDGIEHDAPAIGGGEAELTARDLEARGEPLDVPLPRSGERLVEVVDVEQHLALGRREHAEVRQVRVAAELDHDVGPRGVRQVGGHEQRGATEERERRHEHAAVADRDEFGDPARGLLLQQRDGVGSVR